MAETSSTTLPLRLELGDVLSLLVRRRDARPLESRVKGLLDAHLERLGIPGEAVVEVATADTTRPLRVRIQGEVQPYSPHLLLRTWMCVAPPAARCIDPQASSSDGPFPAGWLTDVASEIERKNDQAGRALLAAFVERVVAQILLERPSRLLARKQSPGFFGDGLPIADDVLADLLRRLLDLGVAIDDQALLSQLIEEGAAIGRPLEDTVEAAFTELRPHRIAIRVHPATLRELLPGAPENRSFSVYQPDVSATYRRLFREMEKRFVSAFGFVLPDLVWVPSPDLPLRTVAVEIGGWLGLPVPMLERGKRLVEARVEALGETVAEPVVHPVTGLPCALVDEREREHVEHDLELTTWGPMDFIILNVLVELSQHPGRLFGLEELEYQLSSVAVRTRRGNVPTPVEAVLARYSLGELTRIRRELVDERLSLRSVNPMLEALMTYPRAQTDANGTGANDSSPEAGANSWRDAYEFVRRRLRPYIRHRHAGPERELAAYRLHPALEKKVIASRGNPALDTEREAIRDAVWKALLGAEEGAGASVLVTTKLARPFVRHLVAPELPLLPVIAEEELGPDVQISAVATIEA
jgi:FHIPEP family